MDSQPEEEKPFATQYQQAILINLQNEDCPIHRCLPVDEPARIPSSYLVPCAMSLGSGQSSFDPYHRTTNDEASLVPKNVAETTPRQSNHAAHLLPTARLYLDPPPEVTMNWGQIDLNLNDYHSNPVEIGCTI